MNIIFNGQLLDAQDPQIQVSPFCSAVQYGHSVFETFRTYQGQAPGNTTQHWERLFGSAETVKLNLPPTLTQAALDKALSQLLATLDLSHDYRCKVLANSDFWWMKAEVLVRLPSTVYEQGVVVGDAVQQRLFSQAKTASILYPFYQTHQAETGTFETLFFTATGQLLEGNISSVVAVIGNALVSPATEVLPGTSVRELFARAQLLGWATEFRDVSRVELNTASEIFVLNAVRGLVPVRQWGDWERSGSEAYEKIK